MSEKCTVWILGDQLLRAHPALERAGNQFDRKAVRVVLVESRARLRRHPYHKRKLVLLLSAMRHYAQELAGQGWQVDSIQAGTMLEGLQRHAESWNPARMITMAASEYGGRAFQMTKLGKKLGIPVEVVGNTQFLVGRFDPIPEPAAGKRYVMEHFYRAMRRHFGLLMDGEEPAGGQWNFDRENRKALPKDLIPPPRLRFDPGEITRQVIRELGEWPGSSGSLGDFALAVTRRQAEQAFDDFVGNRLAQFGPYEDAMSQEYDALFHSVLSPYLNLGLLDPLDMAERVEQAYRQGAAPINSAEGFIRQVIGWREYIYWQYWRTMPGYMDNNFWGADRPIPDLFWSGETRMNCMRTVLERIRETGYAHHIERLMLLSNFSLLAGLDPQQVNDWFLSSFIDAYEWVMAPNVLGMGLHADGGLTATKPYIASANYINKMGDYCQHCAYDRKKRHGANACPFNILYWNFLIENEAILRKSPRMGRNVLGLRYLDEEERAAVQRSASEILAAHESGHTGNLDLF